MKLSDVRSQTTSPPPASAFASSVGTPIVVDTTTGTAWILLPDGRIVMIGEGMSMEQEVATSGYYRGKAAQLETILGGRSLGWNSTTALGDCANYLDTSQDKINDVAVGTTYYIVSTSAQDLTAGSGVDRVKITYLNASGVQTSVVASLNGTAQVSLGAGFTYFQYMESYHSTTADRIAAGAISITSTNGAATVATTVEQIQAGGNRSLSGRFMVPSDCSGYLLDWWVSAISVTMDCRIRMKGFQNAGVANAFHFIDRAFLTSGAVGGGEGHYYKLPAGAEVKISTIPGSAPAGNKLDGNFMLICVKT